ncbi:MAG: hypothetical protein AAB462_00940 [Patescibacteria group bacterium]
MDIEKAQEGGKSIVTFNDADERFLFGRHTFMEVPTLIGQGHKTVAFDQTPPTPLDLFRPTSRYYLKQLQRFEENAVETFEQPVEVSDEQLIQLGAELLRIQAYGPERTAKARNMAVVITGHFAEQAEEAAEAAHV